MTTETKDLIKYDEIINSAMRKALYNILQKIETLDDIGSHSFFISFLTKYKGVILSERVKMMYPEEITIVLQHQFENLVVRDSHFEVDLSFGDILERVRVPFDSIISFSDPSVDFAISFEEKIDNNLSELNLYEDEKESDTKEKCCKKDNNLINFDLLLKNRSDD